MTKTDAANRYPSKAEISAAEERFEIEARGYGKAICFHPRLDMFDLDLRTGARVAIPRSLIAELAQATPAQLRAVTLSPNGSAVTCEPLDVDISVPGLVRRVTACTAWLDQAGRQKSEAKAAAARANGAKGGRPRLHAGKP